MQKTLLVIGGLILLLGLLWPWLARLGFGRLPGDIVLQKGNVTFYMPIVTCLVISGLLSLIAWLFRR